MRISLVIPTIGTSQWIDDAIFSCLQQTEPFDEIVVVDNSKEFSVRKDSRFATNPLVRWERVEPALLPAHENWDRAVRLAEGDYVVIHGDDDLLAPFFVRATHKAIGRGYQLIFHRFGQINENFKYDPEKNRLEGESMAKRSVRINEYKDVEFFLARTLGPFRLRIVGTVFSKSLYEKIGGIVNSNMPREWYTDDLLWFRMASFCGIIAEVVDPTWAYRWVPNWAGNIQSVEEFTNRFPAYIELIRSLVNQRSRIRELAYNPDFVQKYGSRCTAVWEQFANRG